MMGTIIRFGLDLAKNTFSMLSSLSGQQRGDHGRSVAVRPVTRRDVALMKRMLTMFGEAFGDERTYSSAQPTKAYLQRLLSSDSFIAIAAIQGDEIIGGLAAYELRKFEQERSEIYIYDLAVAEPHRRMGVATALIAELRQLAAARGAYVVFVQADHGDTAAIALHSNLGTREDVLHFDIAVDVSADDANSA